MKKLTTCIVLATVVAASSSVIASQIRVFSPPAAEWAGTSADGTSLTSYSAGTWTFAVGSIGSGFDTSDFSTWEANFQTLRELPWIVNPPFAAGRIEDTWNIGSATWTGQQAYVWGFNQKAIDSAVTEWVLVTNNEWIFPAYDELSLSPVAEWNLADAGNTWHAGFADADGFQMQAIPEPSTYALIFGLGILGFLGYRRVRK